MCAPLLSLTPRRDRADHLIKPGAWPGSLCSTINRPCRDALNVATKPPTRLQEHRKSGYGDRNPIKRSVVQPLAAQACNRLKYIETDDGTPAQDAYIL